MRLSELRSKINRIAPNGDIEIRYTQVQNPLSGDMGYQVENFGEVLDTLSPLAGFPWFSVDESTIRALENEYANKVSPVVLPQTHFTRYQSLVNQLNQARDLNRVSDVLSLAVHEQDPYSVYFRVPDNILTPEQFNDWHRRMSRILRMAASGGSGTFKFAGTEQGSDWFGWTPDPITHLILVSAIKVVCKVARLLKDRQYDDTAIEAMFKAMEALNKTSQSENPEVNMSEAIEEFRKQQRAAIIAKETAEQQKALTAYFETEGITASVSAVGKCADSLQMEMMDNGQEIRLSLTRPKHIKGSEEELDVDLSEIDTSSLRQPSKQLQQPEDEEGDNE